MWIWLIVGGLVLFLISCLILACTSSDLDDDSIIGYILIVLLVLGVFVTLTGVAGVIISSACNSDDRLIKEKAEIVEQLETVKSKELLDIVVKEAYDWNRDHNDNEELIIDIDDILLHRKDKK